MPLKRAVLPLLHRADPLVTLVGGANTVLLRGGLRTGYNTDVPGMVTALARAGVQAGVAAGPVLVLGGGATARSAIAALQRAGARSVTAAVRDPASATQLCSLAANLGLDLELAAFGPGPDRDGWLARHWSQPWQLPLLAILDSTN